MNPKRQACFQFILENEIQREIIQDDTTEERPPFCRSLHYDFMGFRAEISCMKWNSWVMQFRDER